LKKQIKLATRFARGKPRWCGAEFHASPRPIYFLLLAFFILEKRFKGKEQSGFSP